MPIVEPDWSQVVADAGSALLRYFCGSFDRPRAADLVQETLIRLVQKHRQGSFSPEKGSHKAYALGIARYVRLEALREVTLASGAGTPFHFDVGVSGSQDTRDDIRDLRRAIAKLRPAEQDILLLMIDADLSLEEISEIVKLPLGTVKSHVHRAKEKLKALLEVKI